MTMKTTKNIKLLFATFICIVTAAPIKAQEQNMFTQYMFNGLALNPAYAGTHETLSMLAHVRSQWVAMPGAPNSQTFSAHAPLKKDRVALGLQVMHNKIGVTSNTSITPSYTFRLKFANQSILSMGLQVQLTHYKSAFSELKPNDPNDVAFAEDVNKWKPNFGTGIYYYSNDFYVGASMPLILRNDLSLDGSPIDKNKNTEIQYLYAITAGYVFEINESLTLKPNILWSGEGKDSKIDLNTMAYLKQMVGLGVSYRWNESVSFLMEIIATDELRFGYSYDYVVGQLNNISNGSHEIMINYRLNLDKGPVESPRYF